MSPDSSAQAPASWEHFCHGADIGIRGMAATLAGALEQAALAMTAVMTNPALVNCNETIEIRCEASSPELLLYDWLNALILQMATRNLIFGRFDVSVDGQHLAGRAHGEAVSREQHRPAVEIKGATMTELSVKELRPGLWCAQCVVDV